MKLIMSNDLSFQAASLPMSIIIIGVGDADFEGMCCGKK
jgi:hypothetical protein